MAYLLFCFSAIFIVGLIVIGIQKLQESRASVLDDGIISQPMPDDSFNETQSRSGGLGRKVLLSLWGLSALVLLFLLIVFILNRTSATSIEGDIVGTWVSSGGETQIFADGTIIGPDGKVNYYKVTTYRGIEYFAFQFIGSGEDIDLNPSERDEIENLLGEYGDSNYFPIAEIKMPSEDTLIFAPPTGVRGLYNTLDRDFLFDEEVVFTRK